MTGGQTTAMRSVVFTDLVGSTELRVRLGEAAADALRRVHDELVADVVTGHGGVVVKGLGDGVMASFESASDAVAAAVALQQAVQQHRRRTAEQAFDVRVGVSAGDVSLESGDLFGVPVIEAARLCATAAANEILVAELVRTLSRGRADVIFEPLGDVELKGLPQPLPTCRVTWPSAVADDAGDVPLPPLLVANQNTRYVGRPGLIERLQSAHADTLRGQARLVLLGGEPGIGKTRTAAEISRQAHEAGAVVLYGRCDEDLGAAFQPFVEMLSYYLDHVEEPMLGRLPAELARLGPQIGELLPGHQPTAGTDALSEQHLLFEATASWLCSLSGAQPLVLVVDDLHWASKPALLLLLHVLRTALAERTAKLLVVGTYRDTDITRTHPLSEVIADLRRLPGVERLAIGGLDADEVEALLESAAGRELPEATRALARVVHEETEGNPFFVAEVVRHLIETGSVQLRDGEWMVAEGADFTIPEGVRDVVGRRVSRLSPAANALLSAAAVIGRDVELDVLAEIVDLGEDAFLDALDEAMRARLVDEVGSEQIRFAHALVRTTLYEELSATRRRRQHRRVAQAIEKLHPDDVSALARHYLEAGPEGGDMSRALNYCIAAAEQAQAAGAFADAEARYRQLLESLQDVGDEDGVLAATALCGLGECQRDQGDMGYRETLLRAARRAISLGECAVAVRAVWSNFRGLPAVVGAVDAEAIAVMEQVLELLSDDMVTERAQVLATMCNELSYSADHERRTALADAALATAAQLTDRHLAAAIVVRAATSAASLERAVEVGEQLQEAIDVAQEVGDLSLQVIGMIWRAGLVQTSGRFAEASALRQQAFELASDLAPTIRWMAMSQLPVCQGYTGDLVTPAESANAALALAQEHAVPDAEVWWGGTTFGILVARGEEATLADWLGPYADQYPDLPTWRLSEVLALVGAGRLDEARAVLANQVVVDETLLVHHPFPGTHPMQLAFINHRLRDPALARVLLDAVEPFAHLWAHYYTWCTGPLTLVQGLSYDVLGDVDRAITTLRTSRQQTIDTGNLGVLPIVDTLLCEVLAAAGRRDEAVDVLDDLRQRTGEQPLPALLARAEAAVA